LKLIREKLKFDEFIRDAVQRESPHVSDHLICLDVPDDLPVVEVDRVRVQ